MTRPIPKRISQAWIDNANRTLQITVKEIKGEANPSYVSLLQEVEQAEADKQNWDTFADWVSETLDARVNRYPVRTSNGRLDAGTVFYSKASNKVWTFELAWKKFCEANHVSN